MYVVAGASGHVGSAVAEELLGRGKPVRVIVRDPAKGQRWQAKGAEVAVGSLDDPAFLTATLAGSAGAFLLLPPNVEVNDIPAWQRALVTAMGSAIRDSKVPHVALLSSLGANLSEKIGFIGGLHHFENLLAELGVPYTALRATYFMENILMLAGGAKLGIYGHFLPDTPIPMVAARDVGGFAARALIDPPAGADVVDVLGPAYAPPQVAEILGEVLGKKLKVMGVPSFGWVMAMTTQGGLKKHAAEMFAEVYKAFHDKRAKPVAPRSVEGTTPLIDVLREGLGGARRE